MGGHSCSELGEVFLFFCFICLNYSRIPSHKGYGGALDTSWTNDIVFVVAFVGCVSCARPAVTPPRAIRVPKAPVCLEWG